MEMETEMDAGTSKPKRNNRSSNGGEESYRRSHVGYQNTIVLKVKHGWYTLT